MNDSWRVEARARKTEKYQDSSLHKRDKHKFISLSFSVSDFVLHLVQYCQTKSTDLANVLENVG